MNNWNLHGRLADIRHDELLHEAAGGEARRAKEAGHNPISPSRLLIVSALLSLIAWWIL